MDKQKIIDLLDQEFEALVSDINHSTEVTNRLRRNKAECIRVRKWLERLKEPLPQEPTWKKNRNLYAKLLLSQLKQEFPLEGPFSECPKFYGVLPMLPKWLSMYTHEEKYVRTTRKIPNSVKEVIVFEDSHQHRLFPGHPRRTLYI